LVPQLHWIFIVDGQGFTKATPAGQVVSRGAGPALHSARPSPNRRFPPSFPWLLPGVAPVVEKSG